MDYGGGELLMTNTFKKGNPGCCECGPSGTCKSSGNGTDGNPNAFSELNQNDWYIKSYAGSTTQNNMYFLKPTSTANNVSNGCSSPAYVYCVIEEAGPGLCTSGSYTSPSCQFRVKTEDTTDCDWDGRMFLRRLMTGKIAVDYGYGTGSCGSNTAFTHALVGPGATVRKVLWKGNNEYRTYIIGSNPSDGVATDQVGCCGLGPIWNLGLETDTGDVTPSSGTFSGTTFKAGWAVEAQYPSPVSTQMGTVCDAVSSGPDTANSSDLWELGVRTTFNAPSSYYFAVGEAGTYKLKVWAGRNNQQLGLLTNMRQVSMDISVDVAGGGFTTLITEFEPQETYSHATYTDGKTIGGPDAAGNSLVTGGPWVDESTGTFSASPGQIITVKLDRSAKWASSPSSVKNSFTHKMLSAIGFIKQ